MEVHAPHGAIHSLKEFFVHLLTVTIGILIALSLDGWVERSHHRSLLREARAHIGAEIRDNRDRLQKGLALAPEAEARLRVTMEAMETHRRTPQAPWPDLNWSFGIYPLSSTAWSSASSAGAVGLMDYSEVQRNTRVYLLQDQFLSIQQRALERWLNLQKWSERMKRPQGGPPSLSPEEMQQVESAASEALIYTQTEESIAGTLVEQYAQALQKP